MTATVLQIPAAGALLTGDLVIPADPLGVVLFAHGSGSSRHSPRNRRVASALNRASLATLLLDLLTEEEDAVDRHTAELRFNIDLLSQRLSAAVTWMARRSDLKALHIGLFGASTGAAAALIAAAELPSHVSAVVSRGGRPDLAGAALGRVQGPTLLIVGGADEIVLQLNRGALSQLRCAKCLHVVPGATHLFEEPGAIDHVAEVARLWFERHLAARQNQSSAA